MWGERMTLSRSKKGESLRGSLVEDVEGCSGDVAGFDGFGEGLLRR